MARQSRRPDPNAPLCAYPGCKNIRASKGKRGPNSTVLADGGDKNKRFTWCNYHRKHPKGKAERAALHEKNNDSL